MKYILLATLLTSAVYAAPFAAQGGQGNGQQQQGQRQQGQRQQGAQNGASNAPQTGGKNGKPSAADLATAVSNWQADTGMVSNFLNTGKGIRNNAQFKQAATVAFNAEVDELTHKAVIDAANGADPNVIAANSTLATGGSFQDVVDKLKLMSVQGRAAVANIDLINENRCVNVLPNIDAYMASTGSSSQAIRPKACDQTGVINGVQGNGPTLPGQPAGSPAAAFAAADALAAGTGNGLVQNGGNGNAGQQAQNGQQAGQQTGQRAGQQAGQKQGNTGGNTQNTGANRASGGKAGGAQNGASARAGKGAGNN